MQQQAQQHGNKFRPSSRGEWIELSKFFAKMERM